jgi:hypothetical protein
MGKISIFKSVWGWEAASLPENTRPRKEFPQGLIYQEKVWLPAPMA